MRRKKNMAKKKAKAASKAPAGEKKYVAKAPIRRLMKAEGADLVAESALELLISTLEKIAVETTKNAIKVAKADKRKKISGADILEATKM
ncbi:MAG: histone-like protein [Promethearchaeota archaeon]